MPSTGSAMSLEKPLGNGHVFGPVDVDGFARAESLQMLALLEQQRRIAEIRLDHEEALHRARRGLDRESDGYRPAVVPNVLLDLGGFGVDDQCHFFGAGGSRRIDGALDEGLATDDEQRLRRGESRVAKALAESGGNDPGLHRCPCAPCSSSISERCAITRSAMPGCAGSAPSRRSQMARKPACLAARQSRSKLSPTITTSAGAIPRRSAASR